jgi:heme A synthase
LDPSLRAFLFGFLGSAAVEVVYLVKLFRAGRKTPAYITHYRFWAVRVLLALMGGALAVAYGVQLDILAIHVGASTPVIIEQFTRTPAQAPK